MASVHGHQVDVDVDDQVALCGPPAELHVFAVRGFTQHNHAVRIFGVVVVEAAVRGEGVIYPIAHCVAQLVLGHPPVNGQGSDQMDVIHAGLGGKVQHGLDDPLADVWAAHGRQGE